MLKTLEWFDSINFEKIKGYEKHYSYIFHQPIQ